MLPNLQVLERISQKIKSLPNNHGEYKRKEHYGLFFLCQKAGLRVSEAINFNPNQRTKKGLYRIEKLKGKKERLVYIPRKVIKELKECEWKPNSTNRFNFYHFLKRIKRELNISPNTELTPHTLRRAFATYHAEAGLPLPLLSKMLGHASVRTTALYWINIYNDDGDDDTADILTGKIWLEKPKKSQPEPNNPVKVSLDKLPEPLTPKMPPVSPIPAKHLTKISQLEQQLSQIQRENNNLKAQLAQEKEQNNNLQQDLSNLSEQNTFLRQEKAQETSQQEQIQQELTEKDQVISQLTQDLTNEREKTTATESNLAQEKQINHNLTQQLQTERETNTNLTQNLSHSEQTIISLQNAYQNAIKDKELAQKQLTQLTREIKNFARTLTQWQKFNYYQQLEKSEFKAQIIHPPPWKKT